MPKPKPDFSGMEEEPEDKIEKGNFKAVVAKSQPKKTSIWQELKSDPDLRESLVPVPDYGQLAAILLLRIEKRLQRVEDAVNNKK